LLEHIIFVVRKGVGGGRSVTFDRAALLYMVDVRSFFLTRYPDVSVLLIFVCDLRYVDDLVLERRG